MPIDVNGLLMLQMDAFQRSTPRPAALLDNPFSPSTLRSAHRAATQQNVIQDTILSTFLHYSQQWLWELVLYIPLRCCHWSPP